MAAVGVRCKYFYPRRRIPGRKPVRHKQQERRKFPATDQQERRDPAQNDKAAPRLRRGRPWLFSWLVHREARGIGERIDDFHGQLDFAGHRQTIREGRGETPLLDGGLH